VSCRKWRCCLVWGALLLPVALPGPLTAAPAKPAAPVRSLEILRDRQEAGVYLLAAVSASLPQLVWLRHVTLDAGTATLDGTSWSSRGAGELVERLSKEKIPSFGPPKLVSARSGEDGYDAFSVVLPYLGPQAPAGGDDLLRQVAPQAELKKLQGQIRSALKDLQLKVQDYRTGSKPVPNGPVDLWPVSIRIEGATFAQVGVLLQRVSRLPRLVVLEELALEAPDKDHPVLSVLLRLSLPVLREGRE